jgi:hypothetical protein
MLTTVEAEIDTSGNVRLLEPVEVKQTTRAIVTLLEDKNQEGAEQDNAQKMLEFLKSNRFKNRKKYSDEEIEAQIEEIRNSWD